MEIQTNKKIIAALATEREEENLAFREYLNGQNSTEIDIQVGKLNNLVASSVDCKECGACCRSLMINVESDEVKLVAEKLNISEKSFNDRFIEQGSTTQIMNSIPCHFLSENICSIYDVRFRECREFPHLHKPNFKNRMFGTLIHYAICPIIFNVLEELKRSTGFSEVFNSSIICTTLDR